MKNILLCALVFISSFSFGAEESIQDLFTLDTIITIPQSNLYRDKINLTCFEDEIWIYTPGKRDDTLDFTVINTKTKACKYLFCPFPSMYFKISDPSSTDISVSAKFITIFMPSDKQLFVIERKKNRIKLKAIIPIKEDLDFLTLKGDELYFAKHYNFHPNTSDKKTMMGKYNLITNQLERFIVPDFKNIEFSHFNPKHWVDFGDKLNFFSQTTEYKINIYNNNLDCVDSILRFKKDWSATSQDQLNKVYELKSSSKSLINLLEPFEDEITRVEAIYQMNDEFLFVVWIPPFHKKNNYYRKLDVWKKNKEGKFELVKENLLDAKFSLSDTITKSNFPIRMNFNTNYFYSNKLIQWKFGTGVDPLNRTQKEVYALNEEYSMGNDEKYVIKIFTINEF